MQLPVAARSVLAKLVCEHPDFPKLAIRTRPEQMSKKQLIAIAKCLGIDILALVKQTKETHLGMEAIFEEKALARLRHSECHPAFHGALELDFTVRVMDIEVVRKGRIVWDSTPVWPYYDLVKNRVMKGWPAMGFHLEILAIPNGAGWPPDEHISGYPDQPYWTKVDLFSDGILPEDFYEKMRDEIETDCEQQDAVRRQQFARSACSFQNRDAIGSTPLAP